MRVFVEAYGCTLNQGEGRRVSQLLAKDGHSIVGTPEKADLSVLVTCTVIEATERKMVKRMKELASQGRHLVVAGCMASVQGEAIRKAVPEAEVVPPTELERITELIPAAGDAEYECFEPRATVDGILPIAQGCLASCSYCISTIARGPLRSYSVESVLQQLTAALARGRREIRLTSLDTGQYGRDMGLDLSDLLRGACAVEGDFRLRVGMMSPMMLRPIIDDLIEAYRHQKVFKFLHLPVQSGSDEILRKMRRGYTVAQFWDVVDAFRAEFDLITLATDVIVGFPGEGEREFNETVELVEELKPDICNITRFSSRPGTAAASMTGRVPGWKVKERSRLLTKLRFEISQRNNERFIGSRLRALTTEEGRDETTVARSDDYRPVAVPGRHKLGEFVDVIIEEAAATHLLGSLPMMEAVPSPSSLLA